jgi:glycerol-3-phosphate acyltransferase PlsY
MGAQSFISILQLILPAYFLGSIPFGLLIGKIGGIDIRLHGSRNIGATNVWRTLGPKFGLFTFLLDAAKGFFAVALAQQIAWRQVPQPAPEDYLAYAGVFAALACIIGHSFPIWLRFKGGKGVATSLGVLIGLLPGFATSVVLAVWVIVFAASRYVSLASVIAVPELTYGANWIKTNTFRHIEVWLVVWPIYLAAGWAILAALRPLERRFRLGGDR